MKVFALLVMLLFVGVSFSQSGTLQTVLQKGHSKYVTCSDFHPSGKYAITGSYDNSIILWSLQSGKQIRIFNKHTAPVWSAVFSKDGTQILSTSADQTILLYSTHTGDIIHSWDASKDEVRQAYFSYSGDEVIMSTNRDGLFIYDRISGDFIGEYHKNYSVAYQKGVVSPDGLKLLTTSSYKGAEVIDLKTKDTLLNIPFDKVYRMEFRPDGKKIALSSSKQFAKIYSAETGKDRVRIKRKSRDSPNPLLITTGNKSDSLCCRLGLKSLDLSK